jgi:hypothetical protein
MARPSCLDYYIYAAMRDRRSVLREPHYPVLIARGMSTTAAFVALGRKLARVFFPLLQNETAFNPDFYLGGCSLTWNLYSTPNAWDVVGAARL